jgi:hypothetical protein
VVVLVYNIIGAVQTRLGLGLPVHLRPHADIPQYSTVSSLPLSVERENHADRASRKLNFVGRPLYQIAVCGYKVCACLSYLRVLSGTDGVKRIVWMKRFIHCFVYVIVIGHFATTMVIVFQCQPVEKSWKPWVDGHCLANYPTWNVRDIIIPSLFAANTVRPPHQLPSPAISSPSSYRYRYSSDCR